MYTSEFEYRVPGTLAEALTMLAEVGDDGRVLAGGQSLIPMMKLRLASPGVLIDINELPGMKFIEISGGHLRIGALVTHNDIVDSEVVTQTNQTMAAAAPWIADPLVRNRGTVCGSIAHCDPEGDWNSVMLAVRAKVVARSNTGGERIISIDDFIVDFFTNSLLPGEMVTEVRIPEYSGPAGGTYMKLERKVGDYATAAVATHLQLDPEGKMSQVGIALTAVNSINTRAVSAEEALFGQTPSVELFELAANLAADASDPEDNVRGPAEYKRNLVRVYTRRGLAKALELAEMS